MAVTAQRADQLGERLSRACRRAGAGRTDDDGGINALAPVLREILAGNKGAHAVSRKDEGDVLAEALFEHLRQEAGIPDHIFRARGVAQIGGTGGGFPVAGVVVTCKGNAVRAEILDQRLVAENVFAHAVAELENGVHLTLGGGVDVSYDGVLTVCGRVGNAVSVVGHDGLLSMDNDMDVFRMVGSVRCAICVSRDRRK